MLMRRVEGKMSGGALFPFGDVYTFSSDRVARVTLRVTRFRLGGIRRWVVAGKSVRWIRVGERGASSFHRDWIRFFFNGVRRGELASAYMKLRGLYKGEYGSSFAYDDL